MVFVIKNREAKTVVRVFYDRFIFVFGVSVRFISDRGVEFILDIVVELCKLFGIVKCRISVYYLMGNG